MPPFPLQDSPLTDTMSACSKAALEASPSSAVVSPSGSATSVRSVSPPRPAAPRSNVRDILSSILDSNNTQLTTSSSGLPQKKRRRDGEYSPLKLLNQGKSSATRSGPPLTATHEIRHLRKEVAEMEDQLRRLETKWTETIPDESVLSSACVAAKEKWTTSKVEQVNAELRDQLTQQQFIFASLQSAILQAPLQSNCREMFEAVHADLKLGTDPATRVADLNSLCDKGIELCPQVIQRFTGHSASGPTPYSHTSVTGGASETYVSNIFILELPLSSLEDVLHATLGYYAALKVEMKRCAATDMEVDIHDNLSNPRHYATVKFISPLFTTSLNTTFACKVVDGVGIIHSDVVVRDELYPMPADESIQRVGCTTITITPVRDAATGNVKMVLRRLLVYRYNILPHNPVVQQDMKLNRCIFNGDLLTAIICQNLQQPKPDVVDHGLLHSTKMASYEAPRVDVNEGGWGPTSLPEQFLNVPYAPFNKGDKLGKAADFVSNYVARGGRHPRDPSGVNAEFQYKFDADEDASFRLVDTAKTTRSRNADRLRPSWNQQRFGGRGGFAGGRGGGRFGADKDAGAPNAPGAQLRMKGQQKQNKRWDRLSNARRMFTSRRRDEIKIDRTASVKVEASWTLIEQFELQQLTRLQANIPDADDLRWCGSLLEYDTVFDRVTSRSNNRITRFDDRDFYYVTTTDDPVIEELATGGEANVFATDAILAHLMASTRSVFPWDIVVQRVNNMVFFDKRDNSAFDLLTVNENSSEPPNSDDPESINHPDRLSLEATMINQNLSQQVVKGDGAFRKEFEHANPFASDESVPATYAYRYRKFDLGSGINLVTRCEVHGVSLKNNNEAFVSTYALNEYDPKITGATEWRKKIDAQRGAILANELKNNANKLAKWTAQALVSGVDEMKLGYVSRVNYKDPYSHVLLGMQSYKPDTFATQIALNQNNMWGIIKMLAELLLEQPEGKYVIMKDPNKPVVRIYSVPADTFEEEGADDEDDGEDDEDNE
ncbi:hypothetical protein Poli38472_012327 [Pythium oligandrum]|uniref:Eukaryotic translation initiation factor 3 subunit D n=1 Tax=Pythium oligandrum TaxID=41045 RepID=A0A8K1CR91_PYTOL|nr:hypothetical protein Poli38472_012327 [Pythium oligandrum]|eukprot:TMW67211.1 hypothetical protein Poli38472_012327 [Pythium oligandrum]